MYLSEHARLFYTREQIGTLLCQRKVGRRGLLIFLIFSYHRALIWTYKVIKLKNIYQFISYHLLVCFPWRFYSIDVFDEIQLFDKSLVTRLVITPSLPSVQSRKLIPALDWPISLLTCRLADP